MEPKKKSHSPFPPHLNEKIIRMEERIDKIGHILLQINDKLIEMKYILKNQVK